MNQQEHIRRVLKEETDQTDDKRSSLKAKLKSIADNLGFDKAIKAVGGIENYVKLVYDNDLKNFYRESGNEPYYISSEPNLYIDDMLVQRLDLPNTFGKEKELDDFRWTSNGMNYRFTAVLYPVNYVPGKKMWRVLGRSGDFGFGYNWITKRNTLGKRARMQIFKQIIDKYNLDNYK